MRRPDHPTFGIGPLADANDRSMGKELKTTSYGSIDQVQNKLSGPKAACRVRYSAENLVNAELLCRSWSAPKGFVMEMSRIQTYEVSFLFSVSHYASKITTGLLVVF